jgi:ferredoxin
MYKKTKILFFRLNEAAKSSRIVCRAGWTFRLESVWELESARSRTRLQRRIDMAFIICEPCIGTKDTACVDACPVDCIHPRSDEDNFEEEQQLYIDPEECIDCGACVPECPVEAIFPEDEVPDQWQNYTEINYKWFGREL